MKSSSDHLGPGGWVKLSIAGASRASARRTLRLLLLEPACASSGSGRRKGWRRLGGEGVLGPVAVGDCTLVLAGRKHGLML